MTFTQFVFESGGYTYRYTGQWTVVAVNGILTGTVTSSGFYTSVDVSLGIVPVATLSELAPQAVNFGSQESIGLLPLLGNLLGAVTDLLFGPTNTTSYANLHTGATPNIAALALSGSDTLLGGTGADTLSGGDGSDTINGGAGNDILNGGTGQDTVVYTGAVTGIVKNGSVLTVSTASEGTDTLTGVEKLKIQGVDIFQFLGADSYVGTEDGPAIAVNLLANDIDLNGDVFTLASITFAGTTHILANQPADPLGNYTINLGSNGTLVINSSGVGLFTPGANFSGILTLGYATADLDGQTAGGSAQISVSAVNDAPIVGALVPTQTVAEGAPWNFTVPANTFTDVDTAVLTYTAELANGDPLPAWLTFNGTTRTFTGSSGDFNGPLLLKIVASDGSLSTSTVFTLTVTAVNDAPITNASAESAVGTEDNAINGTLLAGSDIDGDALTFVLVPGSATNGTVTINPQTGAYTFTPAANYNGPAIFQYVVSDGVLSSVPKTVSLTVGALNDAPTVTAPVADQVIAANAPWVFTIASNTFTDVDGTPLSLSATQANGAALPAWLSFDGATGTFTATPPFAGHQNLQIRITAGDGVVEIFDVFSLTVANTAPSGLVLQGNLVDENSAAGTLIGTLIGTDPDGDSLSYQLLDNAGGRFVLQGNTVLVAAGASLDFEQATTHNITVRVTDALGLTLDKTFAIVIGDIEPEVQVGTGGNDTLMAGDGDAIIDGLGGDDVITTGAGNDTIRGGSGNDTINSGGGNDHVFGEDGNDLINGESDDDTLQGDNGDDSLNGGLGNDTVFGNSGNDTLSGGTGNDRLDGGDGNDKIFADGAAGFVETLVGGSGSDEFFNVALNGTDHVDAGDGNDIIHVDLRNNSGQAQLSDITLGSGQDRVIIDAPLVASAFENSIALQDFVAGAGGDLVDLSPILARIPGFNPALDPFEAGYLRLIQSGVDTLLQVDTDGGGNSFRTIAVFDGLQPSQFARTNFIGGADTSAKQIVGTNGNDLLLSVNSPDQINGLAGTDTVDFSQSAARGVYTNLASGFAMDQFGRNDALTSIESANGTAFADTLIGNAVQNTLYGSGGNDVIYGLSSNDILSGGTGLDLVYGGVGHDFIDGARDADRLRGQDGNDRILGGAGNDRAYGDNGRDQIHGDASDDTILGGNDNDRVYGDAGRDLVRGDAGNDYVNGGAGSDRLYGGSGRDSFVFDTALGSSNVDRIHDFNVASDIIHLENKYFKGLANGILGADAFSIGAPVNAGAHIVYNQATGSLSYDRDGVGGGGAIKFAQVGAHLQLTHKDFFVI